MARLAGTFSLPFFNGQPDASYYLSYENDRLELYKTTKNGAPGASLHIDFLSGSIAYRYHHNRTISQPLARAVGIRKGYRPSVCDLTAGLGRDGFVLASLGCTVVLVERVPVIWALLNDGLVRGRKDSSAIGQVLRNRLFLYHAESLTFIEKKKQRFNTIYLDPMYPETRRSALSKLSIRILRDLAGADRDSRQLLLQARSAATERVVVKRSSGAPCIGSEKPSFQVKGEKHRYDVYLVNHL